MAVTEIKWGEFCMALEKQLKPSEIQNKNYNQIVSLYALISRIVDISNIDIESNIAEILDNYCNDFRRFYHNFNHINQMIDYLNRHIEANQIPLNLEDSIALYTAVLYHDIVYEYSDNIDNESESAKLFLKHFKLDEKINNIDSNWVDKDFFDKVVCLILVTKNSPWTIDYHRFDPRFLIVQADWSQFLDIQTMCISDSLIRSEYIEGFGIKKCFYNKKRKNFLKNLVKNKERYPDDIRLRNIEFLLTLPLSLKKKNFKIIDEK